MNSQKLAQINEQVISWLLETKKLIQLERNHFSIEAKTADYDLVTNVDKKVEEFLTGKIKTLTPNSVIVSEEGFGSKKETWHQDGLTWFVDPIDGTMNFIKLKRDYAVMIALFDGQEKLAAWIYDVENDDLYAGLKHQSVTVNGRPIQVNYDELGLRDGILQISGKTLLNNEDNYQNIAKEALTIRVSGSCSRSFLDILTGKAVAYMSIISPWDFAAPSVLAEFAGLKMTNIDGTSVNMLKSNSVLIATKKAHKDILAI